MGVRVRDDDLGRVSRATPSTDIQSGTGVVGNALMFDRPAEVGRPRPFRSRPEPAWFATNDRAGAVMRQLLAFEGDPRWLRVPGLMLAALRG